MVFLLTLGQKKNVYARRALTMTEYLKYGASALVCHCFPMSCDACGIVVEGRKGVVWYELLDAYAKTLCMLSKLNLSVYDIYIYSMYFQVSKYQLLKQMPFWTSNPFVLLGYSSFMLCSIICLLSVVAIVG